MPTSETTKARNTAIQKSLLLRIALSSEQGFLAKTLLLEKAVEAAQQYLGPQSHFTVRRCFFASKK